jgi:hypothetical protein
LGNPARPAGEDAYVFPLFSQTPAEDNALQSQTQSLLGDPANWRNATSGNTTNNFGSGYALPFAYFHNDGGTGQNGDQSDLFQSQFFDQANRTSGASQQSLTARLQALGWQSPNFGSADQQFSFAQTNPLKGQTDAFGYQSIFGAGTQPYTSLASGMFGRQPGNQLTTRPSTPGILDFSLANAGSLDFPKIDFSGLLAESDGPKLHFIGDTQSLGAALETADQSTFSFAVKSEGKDTRGGPFHLKFGAENKLLGTDFSATTNGTRLSQLEFSQELGKFNLGYEGNAFDDNKFKVGAHSEFFKANFNTNGRNLFGFEISTSILPRAEIGATFQQMLGEHCPTAGVTLSIGGSKKSD